MAKAQSVRIVGGSLRGRRLQVPPGTDVRPTSERARETLFNHLAHGGYGPDGTSVLVGAAVADLCCGTGALGFEALSRGARSAVFVDASRAALDAVRANAASLGIADACTFRLTSLPAGLPSGPFDVVFLDPPYSTNLAGEILAALGARNLLANGGLVLIETGVKQELVIPPGFQQADCRSVGAARLMLLRLARVLDQPARPSG
jgi:16S rRNA (guanine966-N2)-methyltransferase